MAALGGGDIEVVEVDVEGLAGHRLVVATRERRGRCRMRTRAIRRVRRRRPW